MSFTSVSATTNGTQITITYSYSGPGSLIQAYIYSDATELAVGDPVVPSTSIHILSTSYSYLFTQGAAYAIFLRDNDLVPNDSAKYYYIYCKTNNSSNIYLGTKTTSAPFILGDIGSGADKSAILPPISSSAGKLYYIKIKGTGSNFFLVPYITGITYPIASDQLLLTDDTFSAFDAYISLTRGRQVFSNQNYCYSFGAFGGLSGLVWLETSQYNNTLSIANEPSSSFIGAKTINLDQQVHVYDYKTLADNMVILSSLKGNSIHYFSLYRSVTGFASSVYIGFGDGVTVDNNTVSAGNTNYLNLTLSQYDVFNIAFYVNSSSNTIYIINTMQNGPFNTTAYLTPSTEITSSLVYSPTGIIFNTPISLSATNLSTLRIIKYSPKTNSSFSMMARDSADNSIYVPTVGFRNAVSNPSKTTYLDLCIWMLVYNDGRISNAIMFHQYNA